MSDYTEIDAFIDTATRATSGDPRTNEDRQIAREHIHSMLRKADVAARETKAISAELDKQIAEVVRLTVALKVAQKAKAEPTTKPEDAPVVDTKHASSLERRGEWDLGYQHRIFGFIPNGDPRATS